MEETISRNIKYLREMHRMTQDEVAQAIGASDKAVSAWERGERQPRMGYVQKMADLFGIEIELLMDGDIDTISSPKPIGNATTTNRHKTISLSAKNRARSISPQQAILFDRTKDLTEAQMNIVLSLVDAIRKESDSD